MQNSKKIWQRRQILLAKRGGIVYKYTAHLNFSAMKHVALSLLAAACGALSASAVDASNARIWLDEKIQPDFTTIGTGITSDKHGTAPAFARTWQYVSIPLHVEGVSQGDTQPHYIPELKVRVSLAIATTDAKGKPTDTPEMISKEITYVDIPLAKHARKANMGESVVNVGVFVSPSNAFKLAEKDGNLSKKLIAVAVEGTFQGSSCNRVKEKSNDGVKTAVVVNTKEGRGLTDNWWTKKGGRTGAVLSAISETPFVHQYASLGFPPTNPMFGGAAAVGGPAAVAATPDEASTTPAEEPADVDATPTEGDEDSTSSTTTRGKKGKKGKKSRR